MYQQGVNGICTETVYQVRLLCQAHLLSPYDIKRLITQSLTFYPPLFRQSPNYLLPSRLYCWCRSFNDSTSVEGCGLYRQ